MVVGIVVAPTVPSISAHLDYTLLRLRATKGWDLSGFFVSAEDALTMDAIIAFSSRSGWSVRTFPTIYSDFLDEVNSVLIFTDGRCKRCKQLENQVLQKYGAHYVHVQVVRPRKARLL